MLHTTRADSSVVGTPSRQRNTYSYHTPYNMPHKTGRMPRAVEAGVSFPTVSITAYGRSTAAALPYLRRQGTERVEDVPRISVLYQRRCVERLGQLSGRSGQLARAHTVGEQHLCCCRRLCQFVFKMGKMSVTTRKQTTRNDHTMCLLFAQWCSLAMPNLLRSRRWCF